MHFKAIGISGKMGCQKFFSASKNIKVVWISLLGWIEKMMELAKLTALIRDKNANSFMVRNSFWTF